MFDNVDCYPFLAYIVLILDWRKGFTEKLTDTWPWESLYMGHLCETKLVRFWFIYNNNKSVNLLVKTFSKMDIYMQTII